MNWLSELLTVSGGLIKLGLEFIGLRNTPEMKQRDEARKVNDEKDQDARNIKNKDVDAIRRDLSS